MTSSNTLLKKIIGVKDVVVTDAEIYSAHDGVTHLTIDARPNSWNQNKCPFCGRKKLPGYDKTITISKGVERPGFWRSLHDLEDQADNPQGPRVQEHTKYAGYGLAGMFEYQDTTS